jgi:hypothetical protein
MRAVSATEGMRFGQSSFRASELRSAKRRPNRNTDEKKRAGRQLPARFYFHQALLAEYEPLAIETSA